jgi:hypothetical protein
MKETKKNKLKDRILVLLKEKRGTTIDKISIELNLKPNLLAYLAEELSEEKLVELINITSEDSDLAKDYLVSITNKGDFLIDINGGFKRINCRIRLESFWKILKIVAVVINAVAIILIGIYSLCLSNETIKLKKENENLKQRLEQITSKPGLRS